MICIDASVVGRLISSDEQIERLNTRYEEARLSGENFVAPHLLPFEVASLLQKKRSRKILTGAEALGALHQFQGMQIELVFFDGLIERSLALTEAFGSQLTVYDASYLALAEHLKASFWTADRPLFDAVSLNLPKVQFIS